MPLPTGLSSFNQCSNYVPNFLAENAINTSMNLFEALHNKQLANTAAISASSYFFPFQQLSTQMHI